MAAIDAGLLMLIIFLAICVCGLFFVGIDSMRRGLQDRSRAQAQSVHAVWYKQPKVLFGLNNITFALILLAILFLSLFTWPAVRYVLFALIGLLLITSVMLVIYTLIASLTMVRNLQVRSSPAQPKVDGE